MDRISKETEQKISRLQMYEQSIQNLLMQKQQFQIQLIEIESALNELEKTDTAYKIVGNIMVLSKKDELKQDLESKKETTGMRIKAYEKQETDIKEKTTKLQAEVMKMMKDEKGQHD